MSAKVLPLKEEKAEGRLSLETCKRVLKAKAKGLSDEEVYKISDLLYALADIDFKLYQEQNQKETATIIQLNAERYETQSHPLHPGIHRRAS
jgi:hypothetical protein